MNTRPPRLLQALLRAVSSRDAADAGIGDIVEELGERVASGTPPAFPRLWLTTRIVGLIGGEASIALARHLRSGASAVRDASRSVRRSPAHSLAVIAILALGITVGTLTFSVVDAVLLKPLPLDRPDELVSIASSNFPAKPYKAISPQQYFDFRDATRSLSGVVSISTVTGGDATVDGVTQFLDVTYAPADAFNVLGLTVQIGRTWTREDELNGRLDGVLLSDAFWASRFNRDPNALGRTVVIGKRTYQVIGVLSASSSSPELRLTTSPLWAPTALSRTSPAQSLVGGIIGRLQPDATPEMVAAELRTIPGLEWRPAVVPLPEVYSRGVRSWMLLALGAAALVVLVACVNAANLLLARTAHRSQEVAIRSSLGASRRRIALSALVEGLCLSAAATTVAVVFATWGISAVRSILTANVPFLFRAQAIALNDRVLAAAMAAAVVTGLLVAIVPARQMSRASVVDLLKDGAPGATRGGRRWRSAFLVAEMASVCVLVVIGWMFVGSLVNVMTVDLGVDLEHQLAVKPRLAFKTPVDRVTETIARIPGVSGVATSIGASLPVFGRVSGAWITTDMSAVGERSGTIEVLDHRVSPNYFDVAGLTFIRGSVWARDADPAADAPVVLDEWTARRLFGDADPLGRQVTTTDLPGVHRVVGIVPHVRAAGPEDEVPSSAYFPIKPSATRVFAGILVRTSGPPERLVPLITKALEPVAPNQPEPYVWSGNQALRFITQQRRFHAWLMSCFGIAGLLIGAAGIFAVMASMVAQQTREFGVRIALGATPAALQRGVLTSAVRHVAIGLAAGLPAAWWCSRGFASLLFQVTPTDIGAYAGVVGLLGVVALVAAVIPARRASRVDPITSLRS
jgi:predicted permease